MKHYLLLFTALLLGYASHAQSTLTFTGALTATDPTIPSNRLFRNNGVSVCGTAKAYPGTSAATGIYYDTYTFQASAACLTLTLTQNCTEATTSLIFGSLYRNSFDPSNLALNYLADMGVSPSSTTSATLGYTTTPGQRVVVVISGVTNAGTCSSYALLVSTPGVLPVELSRFTAQAQDHATQLNWATAAETNNAYFAVERSLDGRTFEQVGQVPGHGSTTQPHQYQYTDAALAHTALRYYRLRQVDTDGTSAYSPVRSVAYTTETLRFYPNPTTGPVTFSSPVATTLTVRDALGRVAQVVRLEAGTQPVDLHALPAGVYTLTDETTHRTTRLVRVAE